ncbi:MAG: hypothetical protein RXP86_08225 [Acidilobus sp.]
MRSLNAVEAINDYLHFNLFEAQGFDNVPSKFAYDKPPSGRCEDETKKDIYHDEDHIN